MAPVKDDRWPEVRSLRQRLAVLFLNPIQSRIGTRLALCFATIVLLMAAGYAIAIWEFRQLLIQEKGLDRVQQKSAAVLDLHSHLFAFRDQLEDLSDSHNDQQFLRETSEIRQRVLEDIERAKRTFVGQPQQTDGDSYVVVSLEAIETAMPTQIDALADLAEAQDWSAIRLRSQHQVRQLSYLTASLVDRVAAEVTEERTLVAASAERAKRWASISLLGFGGFALLVATGLGSFVTRSITRPLAMLRQGTQALAKGEFQYQLNTAGKDELADLANTFNHAARQLQKLYANLEESEARFRSLIEHSSDFIVVLDRACNIVYVSPSSERVLKLDTRNLLGKHISAIIHAEDFNSMLFAPGKTSHANQTFEFRYRHPDGDVRIIEAVNTDLLDDPNVRGMVLNARDISERRRAEAELRRSEASRLEERINERTRIARELHDTLLQSFQGVLLKFHGVTYVLPDQSEGKKMLESAIQQARAAVTEGRDAVQGLRSSTLVGNDLARAITTVGEGLRADQAGGNCPEFRVQVNGESRDLPPLVRDEVYRIAGEALRNAFRHAGAREIEVDIHYDQWQFRMRVRDDGKGIAPDVLNAGGRAGHHGLPGMKERAELAGGKLAVWSQLDSGTEIELTIPASIAYTKSPPGPRSMSSGEGTG